jgi:hypothetical protein
MNQSNLLNQGNTAVVKQGNTRLARRLLRIAGIMNALAWLPICRVASVGNHAGVFAVILLPLVFGLFALVYATSQNLWFEIGKERTFKAVCKHLGFAGEANDYVASVRKGIQAPKGTYVPTQKKVVYPDLREVWGTHERWVGVVHQLPGMTVEDFNDNAAAFALSFNAKFCGFDKQPNGWLRVMVGDAPPVPGAYNYGQAGPSSGPQNAYTPLQQASQPSSGSQALLSGHAAQNAPSAVQGGQNVIHQVVPSVYAAPQPDYRVANVYASELALLRGVPMARDIDGNVWHMPIEEKHVLIAASSGGGKGSWIWSLVFGLVPAWQAGLVEFWGCDPKMNELAMGRDFWTRYADNDADSVALLEEAVNLMHERGRAMQGIRRKFVPSLATPLIVLVIDELGYVSALMPDKKLRERATTAITALLNKGRSPGIAVVGVCIDPRKSVIDNRDGYAIRIAGRMPAPMCDLVLGDGMWEAGARTDLIPPPPAGSGVAYVIDETTMEPLLVRAAWCSDDDIRNMMAGLPKPSFDAGGAATVKDEQPEPAADIWSQWGLQYKVE